MLPRHPLASPAELTVFVLYRFSSAPICTWDVDGQGRPSARGSDLQARLALSQSSWSLHLCICSGLPSGPMPFPWCIESFVAYNNLISISVHTVSMWWVWSRLGSPLEKQSAPYRFLSTQNTQHVHQTKSTLSVSWFLSCNLCSLYKYDVHAWGTNLLLRKHPKYKIKEEYKLATNGNNILYQYERDVLVVLIS